MKLFALIILVINFKSNLGNVLQCDLGRGKKGVCVSPSACASFERGKMYFPDDFCNENYASFCCETLKHSLTTTTTTERSGISDHDYEDYADFERFEREQIRSTHEISHEIFDLNNCGKLENTQRIAGGVNAKILEFPWIALIGYGSRSNQNFGCGGSLITGKIFA